MNFGNVHPSDVLDMPVDPNEPTYCLCHQVSYGEMIGCDNTDVWFCLYDCIDFTFLKIRVKNVHILSDSLIAFGTGKDVSGLLVRLNSLMSFYSD